MSEGQKSVALVVAGYHPGNPSDYLQTAFAAVGWSAEIVPQEQLSSEKSYDLHLLVDSGKPFGEAVLDFVVKQPKVAFWNIDFRHNKDRADRKPNDWQVVKMLAEGGHTIFQAQFEDAEECKAAGIESCFWLPLAADPNVWSNTPPRPPVYDLAFVGNVFDAKRQEIIQGLLTAKGLKFAFAGPSQQSKGAWKEDGAKVLRAARVGFNVNSFFGSPVCFDINMRFFETFSTGTPLVTNWVPSIGRLFKELPPFLRCYRNQEELLPVLQAAFNDQAFLSSGNLARGYIERSATYAHRVVGLLKQLGL